MISVSKSLKKPLARAFSAFFAVMMFILVVPPASAAADSSAAETLFAKITAPEGLSPQVTLYADGRVRSFSVTAGTVADLLKAKDISLDENDRVSPALTTALESGMTVTVSRASVARVTVHETIPPVRTMIANEYMPKGAENIITPGTEGLRTVTYDITMCAGKEISRRAVSETVVVEPTTEVVEYGPGGTIVAPDGSAVAWSHKIDGQATAYTTEGYRQKYNRSGKIARTGTIAVDPKVIPLGTMVYVESPNGGKTWVYGTARAEDTGGAIKGTIIDLFFDTRAECWKFGRRNCTIYILEVGA